MEIEEQDMSSMVKELEAIERNFRREKNELPDVLGELPEVLKAQTDSQFLTILDYDRSSESVPVYISPETLVPLALLIHDQPLAVFRVSASQEEQQGQESIASNQNENPEDRDVVLKDSTVYADGIENFPYHFAVHSSDGSLAVFLDLLDGLDNNEDPNSIMPLRVSKYSTSRESVCAAEYAYLLGYQKVGDSLATRMVGKPPSLAKSLTPTRVKLLGDINSFPYVYAVQTSEGSVDDCEELLEVVDNDVDKIDARIEVEVMLEIESTTVSWSAVEYACHLGYVDIVKHLLLK
ncbi:hypothetical protein PPTG_15915 [Phytophthora nicotianae INRA-310]|uniref:Uncharacterized protein n=4 Tax=Phytophthora nicotianae TaxID=4792 RepID=W2PRY7_PHYN3|nr:hypothetical protein PPTG_15915 [Phytophthora nicotianae INRA-310]ETN03697.1 hypothetical protein PPTG_15915 [Phytophthora nicotianae INRA-310]KUF77331.1 hypothetical protein AM587_10010159 [Phytophthora nicotianae]KUF87382.1 hypothetical protein AM587_10001719 [Phytophthora nicotianae]